MNLYQQQEVLMHPRPDDLPFSWENTGVYQYFCQMQRWCLKTGRPYGTLITAAELLELRCSIWSNHGVDLRTLDAVRKHFGFKSLTLKPEKEDLNAP